MSTEKMEFVRSLLNEDGFININHPIFEAEKEKTENQTHAITNVLEIIVGEAIVDCLTKEEVVKNLQYLTYERFENFLYDMEVNEVKDFTKNATDEVIQGLATAVLFEEANKNSPYKPIQWIYDLTSVIRTNFIIKLVNEVAKLYLEGDMDRVESPFLSFYSAHLEDTLFDEVEFILNKVIMYAQGEERIRFDVENTSELYLYSDLISNAKSFSYEVTFYEIDYTDEEILDVYWKLHEQLTSEIKSFVPEEDEDTDDIDDEQPQPREYNSIRHLYPEVPKMD